MSGVGERAEEVSGDVGAPGTHSGSTNSDGLARRGPPMAALVSRCSPSCRPGASDRSGRPSFDSYEAKAKDTAETALAGVETAGLTVRTVENEDAFHRSLASTCHQTRLHARA